jgi:hypothetical protein
MMTLPHLVVADSLRAVTICLWAPSLILSFWVLWYNWRIQELREQVGASLLRNRLMWWHILVMTLVFDSMSTEISWKIIFNGVGKAGISLWTYPNVLLYALTNVGLVIILKLQRKRYIRARMFLGRLEIEEAGERKESL